MSVCEPGIFLVDKPVGPSSFAMVKKVRWLTGVKKVGHAGTLDPFASGLLVICVGRPATKLISRLMEGEKEYIATLRLGIETTTLDAEGDVVRTTTVDRIAQGDVFTVLERFTGEQEQIPPSFSALKHKGKPLYHYARQGITITKPPRRVNIPTIEWLDRRDCVEGDGAELSLRVVCSKGTYIRTLAADIGSRLGCGAFLSGLRRTRSGIFSVERSFPGSEFHGEGVSERFVQHRLSLENVRNMLQ